MKLEMLISAVNKEPRALAERMNINTDAIIINQLGELGKTGYREFNRGPARIRVYDMGEKGVGLSRNNALMRATGDICLFCDDDIIYRDTAPGDILKEFNDHPQADMLLFNVEVKKDRKTYYNNEFGRVRLHNCGRYPAYSMAIKREVMQGKNLYYSLLFGGGARFSNGEDSLFIRDCIKKGVKVYKTPVIIGREEAQGSTWFNGYNEKFFRDRGVLYHHLYGKLALPLSLRFLLAHKDIMCRDIPWKKAFKIMAQGVKEEKSRIG